ncbi:uncharacterized protein MONBRDRAFT_36220 [Monosiga brevicollis MX1]|uniref:Uncharacterized protein n=1 Tax=Monosiga brevicollis TaxID=81824 RepID=A9UTU3_MONBE|nr:uncharacterized protein MONBRDRAFT_36220 [Monosiga brevicollis MX1]EDQ91306.1 predicted protein [Monosiga brevicollis MX1]|eukprot:XP_001743728.1 hypothetical protein [Monosiga brevicollis MX1]
MGLQERLAAQRDLLAARQTGQAYKQKASASSTPLLSAPQLCISTARTRLSSSLRGLSRFGPEELYGMAAEGEVASLCVFASNYTMPEFLARILIRLIMVALHHNQTHTVLVLLGYLDVIEDDTLLQLALFRANTTAAMHIRRRMRNQALPDPCKDHPVAQNIWQMLGLIEALHSGRISSSLWILARLVANHQLAASRVMCLRFDILPDHLLSLQQTGAYSTLQRCLFSLGEPSGSIAKQLDLSTACGAALMLHLRVSGASSFVQVQKRLDVRETLARWRRYRSKHMGHQKSSSEQIDRPPRPLERGVHTGLLAEHLAQLHTPDPLTFQPALPREWARIEVKRRSSSAPEPHASQPIKPPHHGVDPRQQPQSLQRKAPDMAGIAARRTSAASLKLPETSPPRTDSAMPPLVTPEKPDLVKHPAAVDPLTSSPPPSIVETAASAAPIAGPAQVHKAPLTFQEPGTTQEQAPHRATHVVSHEAAAATDAVTHDAAAESEDEDSDSEDESAPILPPLASSVLRDEPIDPDTWFGIVDRGDTPALERLCAVQPRGLRLVDKTQQTLLHLAVLAHQPEMVKRLLELGLEVNALGGSLRETPLHIACRQEQIQSARLLLDAGADSTLTDINFESARDICSGSFRRQLFAATSQQGSDSQATDKQRRIAEALEAARARASAGNQKASAKRVADSSGTMGASAVAWPLCTVDEAGAETEDVDGFAITALPLAKRQSPGHRPSNEGIFSVTYGGEQIVLAASNQDFLPEVLVQHEPEAEARRKA